MLRLNCVRVAYECERHTALDQSQTASHCRYVLVALRLTGLVGLMRLNRSYYNQDVNGGNATTLRRYYDFSNLCHFFRVEAVDLFLLFLFSLFYVIYHRPSV